jgi:hypothetical protein
VHAGAVPQFHEGRELVDGEEALYPVAELFGDIARVIGKRLGGVARLPSAAILQRLRQVPVIERRERLDAIAEELVEEPIVEVETLRIRRAGPLREYPRPGDREPVCCGGERLHRLHVLPVAVIMIIGDIAVVLVPDFSSRVRKRVPDRQAAAVLVDGTFDLIRGGGRAPDETLGKGARGLGPNGHIVARLRVGLDGGRRRREGCRTDDLRKIASRE